MSLLIGACTSRTLSPLSVYDTNPNARPEPYTTFTGRTKIVKAGDNLYSIAFEAGFDARDVARWNNMDDTNAPIYIGQEIKLYPSRNENVSSSPTVTTTPPTTTPPTTTPPTTTPPTTTSGSSNYTPAYSSNNPTNWIWPARGEIISEYSTKKRKNGIEIAGRSGTPISVSADGRVVYAGTGLIGFGRIIIVKHSEQYISVYAHNSRLVVNEGDNVVQGQKIAEMGQTDTDRVKLHFEIRRNGKPVDPLQLLPKG